MARASTLRQVVAAVPGARWLKRKLVGGGTRTSRMPVTLRPRDRGPAPEMNEAGLRAAYEASGLAGEPDTFILYRIIGNDLVPRHRAGQSRENLAFILEHEPELPGCEKRFVVNRITESGEERTILRMLEEAGMPYLHVPFEFDEYRRRSWDISGVPAEYAPYGGRFDSLSPEQRGRVLMRLYRHKNNYVMNNNGARNIALGDGRARAKWVLPWDGNCFVTADAWAVLRSAVCARPEVPYQLVPMARVTDNRQLLRPGFRPDADEEPQILFRRDSSETFDCGYFYGRRPKVELFWRLGVPGQWDDWPLEPWDLPCPGYSPDAGAFGRAGWVARLFSGNENLEEAGSRGSLVGRGLARVEATKASLDWLDGQALDTALKPEQPVFVRESVSSSYAGILENPPFPEGLVEQLRNAADEALGRGPYSVVDKTTLPPSGDRRDYWHPAPYYWPHPLRLPWLPYVRRDGERVPGTRLYEPSSDQYDRTRLQRLFDDGFVLTLACSLLGEDKYGYHGAELVRGWFLEPETAMNPHLEYAQVRRGHNNNRGSSSGVIEMKDMYFFLDAVRLLRKGDFLDAAEYGAFKKWLARYLDWLVGSEQGRKEKASGNNHGTYYDLQVGSIAAFLGERLLLRDTLRDSRFRIVDQIDPEGRQPREMARTATAHYCCFNLQGWVHLARLAESIGEDLWAFSGPRGQGLQKAMEWLLAHMGRPWPYPQIDKFDDARFFPIHYAYQERFGNPHGVAEFEVPEKERIKPLFFPHDGIRPFWQLG